MNKRNLMLVILLVLSLTLTFCSAGSSASTAAATTGTDTVTASADGAEPMQGELSTVARDILGIFKLEGTDLAVDSAQAATLLPLWQAYRSLLNSDTAASAELDALKTQIDEALTTEQHDAISAMNLTAQDMFALAEQLGVTQAPGSADGTATDTNRPSFQFGGGGPAMAGGGAPPSGAGGMPNPGDGGGFVISGEGGEFPGEGAGGLDPQAVATLQAGRPAGAQRDRFSLVLLDPLIELLKERSGS